MSKEQFIHIDEGGNKFYYKDRKMTIRHREDGPAFERADGGKEWFINGKRHREDGPAFEGADGYKVWYINDMLHREDGPAFEGTDGCKGWFINGKRLTQEEFDARMNPVELTEQDAWQDATNNWIKLTLEKYNGFDPDELTQVFMLGPFAGWSERMVYELACNMDDANKRALRHK